MEGNKLRRDESKETSVSVAHRDLMDLIDGARSSEPGGTLGGADEGSVDSSSSSLDQVMLDSEGSSSLVSADSDHSDDDDDDSDGSDSCEGSDSSNICVDCPGTEAC